MPFASGLVSPTYSSANADILLWPMNLYLLGPRGCYRRQPAVGSRRSCRQRSHCHRRNGGLPGGHGLQRWRHLCLSNPQVQVDEDADVCRERGHSQKQTCADLVQHQLAPAGFALRLVG